LKGDEKLSFDDYVIGRELLLNDPPFYALIQAAMRKADTDNLEKLKSAFPEVWEELNARYHVPGGRLTEEERGER
jgi:hypothetical protein